MAVGSAPPAENPGGEGHALAARAGGSFHPAPTGGGEAVSRASHRCAHVAAPRSLRHHWIAAESRRHSGVSHGHQIRRPRTRRKPVAGLAAFRRTLGAALDGPDALRRIARARGRLHHRQRLALPRLPHPCVQRGRALRSISARTSGRRSSPQAAAPSRHGHQ